MTSVAKPLGRVWAAPRACAASAARASVSGRDSRADIRSARNWGVKMRWLITQPPPPRTKASAFAV